MSTKNLIHVLGVKVFAVLLALAINSGTAQTVAQNVTVPYAITYQDIVTDATGKQIQSVEYVSEQRSNGDRSQVWPLAGGKHKRIIEFLSADLTVSANDVNNNTSTLGKGQHKVLIPDQACQIGYDGATKVSAETVLGFNTTHYRFENPDKMKEVWVAGSDLGCVVLKTVVQWRENGVATGSVNAIVATKIVAGPPPDADFALPANAVDVPPSQYDNSIEPGKAGDAAHSRLDAIYQTHKAAREANAGK